MTETTTGIAPRWQRRKDARPGEISQAALDLFVQRGYAASRLEDIARHAGCTKGTIFLYFANKEELFKAVVRENILPHITAAEQAFEAHQGTMPEMLETLLRMRWQALFESRLSGLPKLMLSEAANFPELARFYHDEIVDRTHRLFVRTIERGIERGEFRAVDAEQTAWLVVSPLLVASLWKHSFHQVCNAGIDPDAYFESHLNLVFRALAPAPHAEAMHA